MFFFIAALSLIFYGDAVSATLHHLFVGAFSSPSIYSVGFDDQKLSLTLLNNITTQDNHFWLTLDQQKENLYTTSVQSWSSYEVNDYDSLENGRSLDFEGNCTGSQAIFMKSSPVPPYTVYGATFGGDRSCCNVLSVDRNGALSDIVQAFDYGSGSGIHGLAIGPDNGVLYSADDSGNALWTHTINPQTGKLAFLDRIDGPAPGSHPRHITVHPKGLFAYVIFEGTNKLGVYGIDPQSARLEYTNISFPLIPSGYKNSQYWSDEVQLSYSNEYLWATSRSQVSDQSGYISAYQISETGDLLSQLFLSPTTSSGGQANAVAPSTFSDEFVALTDNEKGFLQIWRFSAGSADVVATLDIQYGGCCANAVWYD